MQRNIMEKREGTRSKPSRFTDDADLDIILFPQRHLALTAEASNNSIRKAQYRTLEQTPSQPESWKLPDISSPISNKRQPVTVAGEGSEGMGPVRGCAVLQHASLVASA